MNNQIAPTKHRVCIYSQCKHCCKLRWKVVWEFTVSVGAVPGLGGNTLPEDPVSKEGAVEAFKGCFFFFLNHLLRVFFLPETVFVPVHSSRCWALGLL